MDSRRLDREATVALAWVGDAEFTLFVRETMLFFGLRDTPYMTTFTSREAHAFMLYTLRGVPITRHLASEIFEAAFASDKDFRLTVEKYVVGHVRLRMSPGDQLPRHVWENASGSIIAPSCFQRYLGGVPTFALGEEDWTQEIGEEREAGRLLGFTIWFRRRIRKVLGRL